MTLTKEDTAPGFIGAGLMGRHMAEHLLAAGYRLRLHDKIKSNADELLAKGAVWCDTVAELAESSNVVISIIGFPKDVEEVYLGSGGVVENAAPGSLLVDMTTSSPELAVRIYHAAREKGLSALDAPVSGDAKGASLSIMAGGDKEAFDQVLPLFQVMGKTILLQGGPGAGQHCKMCNQIAIAANMTGVCEAIAYAVKAGLNPETMFESIKGGAAGSSALSNLGPRILRGDFNPGFYVKHFIKDMEIAFKSAAAMDLDTPGLDLALSRYRRLQEQGGENYGTQALFKLYKV